MPVHDERFPDRLAGRGGPRGRYWRSRISMMTMCPPQQEHGGRGSGRPAPAPAAGRPRARRASCVPLHPGTWDGAGYDSCYRQSARGRSAAVFDRRHDLELAQAQMPVMGGPISRPGSTKDVSDLERGAHTASAIGFLCIRSSQREPVERAGCLSRPKFSRRLPLSKSAAVRTHRLLFSCPPACG